MRLPNAVQERRSWLIDEIAPDFRLLDVWRLPARGGPDEFDSLLAIMASLDPTRGDSKATRALFRLRLRMGALLGWDDAAGELPVPGRAETTLGARIPQHLRDRAREPESSWSAFASTSFAPLYRTDDEWAAELSNRTVHGVLHLAWIDEGGGRCHGQMAVYVKPRGKLGEAYMALIGPFRHVIVYPALMRQIGRAWDARDAGSGTADAGASGESRDRPL
jgi:hypothetical protein